MTAVPGPGAGTASRGGRRATPLSCCLVSRAPAGLRPTPRPRSVLGREGPPMPGGPGPAKTSRPSAGAQIWGTPGCPDSRPAPALPFPFSHSLSWGPRLREGLAAASASQPWPWAPPPRAGRSEPPRLMAPCPDQQGLAPDPRLQPGFPHALPGLQVCGTGGAGRRAWSRRPLGLGLGSGVSRCALGHKAHWLRCFLH